MIAALLLLTADPSLSTEDALDAIRKARPGVRLSAEQTAFVERTATLLAARGGMRCAP
jgi:hypothetical protein